MNRRNFLIIAAWIITLIGALAALSYRYSMEQANRAAGLLTEYRTISELATAQQRLMSDALDQLKNSGLVGVAINEERVLDLLNVGRARYDGLELIADDPSDQERINRAVARRELDPAQLSHREQINALPIGLNPEEVTTVQNVGLVPIARLTNHPGYNAAIIRELLNELGAMEVHHYLPSGDQVLGNRSAIEATVDGLIKNDINYITIEFASLAGDRRIATELPDRTIRLHSIQQAEIDRMSPGAVAERMAKAVAERNVRWLLIRPNTMASETPMDDFSEFVAMNARAITKERAAMKEPRPFVEPVVFPVWQWVAIAGIVALLFLAAPSRGWQIAAGFIGLLGLAAGAGFAPTYFTLAVAVAAPVAGFLLSQRMTSPWGAWGIILAASITGGLVVAATLIGLPYAIQLKQFMGVKAAHYLPLVIVGALLVGSLIGWKELAAKPMLWGPVLLGMVALVAVQFMLARTGNDNPGSVSGLELQFRALLERFLPARPRTKEFLVGHPALLLGLAMLRRGDSRWQALGAGLTAFGMIGAASIVNTFCHLHTPLHVTVWRVGIGIGLGALFGGVAWAILRPFVGAKQAE